MIIYKFASNSILKHNRIDKIVVMIDMIWSYILDLQMRHDDRHILDRIDSRYESSLMGIALIAHSDGVACVLKVPDGKTISTQSWKGLNYSTKNVVTQKLFTIGLVLGKIYTKPWNFHMKYRRFLYFFSLSQSIDIHATTHQNHWC